MNSAANAAIATQTSALREGRLSFTRVVRAATAIGDRAPPRLHARGTHGALPGLPARAVAGRLRLDVALRRALPDRRVGRGGRFHRRQAALGSRACPP